MTDKTKTPTESEPVDAEFETLDDARPTDKASTKKGRSWLIRLVLIIVVVGLIGAAGLASWQYLGRSSKTGTTQKETSASALLATQVQQVQDDLAQFKTKDSAAQQALETRLVALETKTPDDSALRSDLDNLNQRLDQFQEQIDALATSNPDQSGDNGAALQSITERIEALEKASNDRAQSETPVLDETQLVSMQSRLDALEERLQALEAQDRQPRSTAAGALALLALQSAAQSGEPFVHEWQTLARLLPETADVRMLEPLAKTGVDSLPGLVRDFDQQLAILPHDAAAKPEKPKGIMARAKTAMASLVNIRRIDNNSSDEQAVFDQARSALQDNDLADAVKTLNTLPGEPRKAMHGWLVRAQARLTLDQALVRIKTTLAESAL